MEQKVHNYFDNHRPALSLLILCTEFTHSYDNCSKPKDTGNNCRVYFVVLCTLGNPRVERFTGWEAPLGCCQLHQGLDRSPCAWCAAQFWGLLRALWDPPLRGCILSPWKLPGSFSAEFYAQPEESWVPTNATLLIGCFPALHQYLTGLGNFIKWYSGACQNDKTRRIT